MKKEKGKIARAEWSAIRTRYERGESFASIARSYGCTAPAIRYIVMRRTDAPEAGMAMRTASSSHKSRDTERIDEKESRERQSVLPAARPQEARLISPALSERINSDIAAFIAALDTGMTEESPESCQMLLDVTDRLMRSAARLRIEVERGNVARRDEAGGKRKGTA